MAELRTKNAWSGRIKITRKFIYFLPVLYFHVSSNRSLESISNNFRPIDIEMFALFQKAETVFLRCRELELERQYGRCIFFR